MKMKITPAKDYKKPLYAIGLAAAILTVSVTGCTDPETKTRTRKHRRTSKPTEEVQIAGDVQVVDPDVELAGETDVYPDPTTSEDVQIEGEMTVWSDPFDDDVHLDGGVQICPDYEVDDDYTDDTNNLADQGIYNSEET
jgi:hypothetical protein